MINFLGDHGIDKVIILTDYIYLELSETRKVTILTKK